MHFVRRIYKKLLYPGTLTYFQYNIQSAPKNCRCSAVFAISKNTGTSQISKYCIQNGPSGEHETGYTNKCNPCHYVLLPLYKYTSYPVISAWGRGCLQVRCIQKRQSHNQTVILTLSWLDDTRSLISAWGRGCLQVRCI